MWSSRRARSARWLSPTIRSGTSRAGSSSSSRTTQSVKEARRGEDRGGGGEGGGNRGSSERPRDIVPFAFVLARVVPDRVEAETGVGFFTAREDPGRCPIRQSPVALGRLVDRTPEAPRRSYASDREPRTLSPNLHHQAQKEADAKVLNEATRVAKAHLEHIASLDGDPDILYKHAANYALKLATNGGAGMRALRRGPGGS